jgi:hypothetical protein
MPQRFSKPRGRLRRGHLCPSHHRDAGGSATSASSAPRIRLRSFTRTVVPNHHTAKATARRRALELAGLCPASAAHNRIVAVVLILKSGERRLVDGDGARVNGPLFVVTRGAQNVLTLVHQAHPPHRQLHGLEGPRRLPEGVRPLDAGFEGERRYTTSIQLSSATRSVGVKRVTT